MTLRLVVSADPLRGVSALRDSLQEEYRGSFASTSAIRTFLIQLHGLNLRSIACLYDPALVRHLRAIQSEFRWDVLPIVPNMDRYSRFLQNFGARGSAVRLLRELAAPDSLSLGLRGLSLLPALRGDLFSTMIVLLAAYDLTQFRRFRPRLALLHPAVTDVFLANGQGAALQRIVRVIGTHQRGGVGLLTENLGVLLELIEEQGLEIPLIAGPLNRTGYRVTPSLEACLRRIPRTRASIYATLASLDRAPTQGELAFLSEAGVAGIVVEVPDARAGVTLVETAGSLRDP